MKKRKKSAGRPERQERQERQGRAEEAGPGRRDHRRPAHLPCPLRRHQRHQLRSPRTRPSPASPTAGHTVRNFAGSVGSYFAQGHPLVPGPGRVRPAVRPRLRRPAGRPARHVGPPAQAPGHDRDRPAHRLPAPGPHLRVLPGPRQRPCRPAASLGELLLNCLVRFLGTIGSFIFLLAALAAFLLFSTRWSLAKTLRFAKGAFESTAKEVRIQVTDRQKAKEKDRMREKVRDKYAAPPAAPDPKAEKAARKAEKEAEREREREERRLAKEAARRPVARRPAPPPSPSPRRSPSRCSSPIPARRAITATRTFTLLETGPAGREDQPGRAPRQEAAHRGEAQGVRHRGRGPRVPPRPDHHDLRVLPGPGHQGLAGPKPDRGPGPGPGDGVGPHPAHRRQVHAGHRDPQQQARDHQAPRHHRVAEVPGLALQADLRPGQGRPRRRRS
ncbi:MAG: hypothetical protein MZV70_71110 [Desulfobacterales bacterium]|nr:hypothetical protein [Desulfobacterales bacterium]